MLLKLAWRNIWRNKRRTYITAASILFAVLLAVFMESLQKGAWDNMIGNVVSYYVGYAQVHQRGYWADQSIDKAMAWSEDLQKLPEAVPQIKAVLPRLETFALASSGNLTSGVLVIGIEPAVETGMTRLHERITKGAYIDASDKAVLVADGIAEQLRLEVGDTLVLVSQGYRGANAAGKYPIKGLLHFPSPELNKQMVYLPLEEAQWLFAADGLVTSATLHIEQERDIAPALAAVSARLDKEAYEVMDWKELLPELLQAKAFDSVGNYMVYFILYLVIAFGIFGTILMMTKERQYEFGILTAIGMKRSQLAITVWLETLFLGFTGALAGIIAGIPVVWYFMVKPLRFTGEYAGMLEQYGFEPIFPATLRAGIFIAQALTVLLITSVLALYPVWKIKNLKPMEAMRA